MAVDREKADVERHISTQCLPWCCYGLTATLLTFTGEEQREENQQLGLLNAPQADELT